jgi:outer membrane receptor protein involved in Fe transport
MCDVNQSFVRRPPTDISWLTLITTAVLAAMARAGDDSSRSPMLEEIIVTAQKRVANLQQVAASVQALDARKLEELHIEGFDDYVKYFPSLSSQNNGPSQEQLFIRGVTNGTDGLAVGSQPTVAVYLDEQPVTTIAENLDIHIYDIARVEELSGPQGTLFGASSMAGTLRIITNKPTTTGFQAAFNLDANTVTGVPGSIAEGFVNLPLTDRVAIRLVGFAEHDGGYVNNVLGPPGDYPTSGAVRSNAAVVEKHFNGIDTTGGRAALKFDLGKSWTITPSVMLQHQKSHGVPGYEPVRGDLNVSIYTQQSDLDRWWQAAMTVEGKIGNFDIVYAGGYINRSVDSNGDFADYSYYYDQYYGHYFGEQFRNDAGALISPLMTIASVDRFSKLSHEVRLASPQDWHLRFVAGLFLQQQIDDTRNEIRVDGLASIYSITGLPGVQYLNAMSRVDRDRAVFGETSYDLTPRLTLTAGLRRFAYDNTVYGFYGYNSAEALCQPGSTTFGGAGRPCIDVDQRDTRTGTTYNLTLKYQLRPERMIYTTWSTGFRPGGINRTRDAAPYRPDYLSNYEAGVKTSWLAHRLRFNGAVFFEAWRDPQYTICGPNCVYEVINAGAAEIRGVESQLQWAATDGLTLSASATWLDAKLTDNACRYGAAGSVCNNSAGVADSSVQPVATAGAPLPVPRVKGNVTVRYNFVIGEFEAHAQAAGVVQSAVRAPPMPAPGYGSLDLGGGLGHGNWTTELYVKNVFDERGPQGEFRLCGVPNCPLAEIPIVPRTIGVRFGQKF